MKTYLSGIDAVSDLHNEGYSNDFQPCGNDLLWVQGKIFIRIGEFAIKKYYKVNAAENEQKKVVFGIIAPHCNIKGILTNHYTGYIDYTPPVLLKKINELNHQC